MTLHPPARLSSGREALGDGLVSGRNFRARGLADAGLVGEARPFRHGGADLINDRMDEAVR